MSTQELFDRLISDITCSQPLRDLWDKGRNLDQLFRSTESRSCFLASLMARAPYKHLEHKYFNILMDLCVQLLKEASLANDFTSMSKLFHSSRMYAMVHLDCPITIATCLRSYHEYHNVDFWLYSTRYLLAQDIARWEHFSEPKRNFLNLPNDQIYVLFAINRIQSTVTSMQYLRIALDTFVEYLSKILEILHLNDSGVDITITPSMSFKSWLLRILSRLSTRMNLPNFTTSKLDMFRSECSEGKLFDEVGYSSIQEVILYIAELSCNEPVPKSAYDSLFRYCICGATTGSWVGCGVTDPLDERNGIPSILCEVCFRQLLSNPLQSDGNHEIVEMCPIPQHTPFTMQSFHSIFYEEGKQPNINFNSIHKSGLLNVKAAHEYLQMPDLKAMQAARDVISRRPTILVSSYAYKCLNCLSITAL